MPTSDQRPPLVLLHGALGAAAQFSPLSELLSPYFRVLTFDFAGHGGRSAAPDGWRMQHFVEELAAWLQAELTQPAQFLGYSMGGYVALALAAQHPALVRGVVTLGTKFVWDEATAAHEAARLDPAVISAKVPVFAATLTERHTAGAGWEAVVRGTADLLRDLGRAPLLTPDVLTTIAQPVRVLVGDRDATVSIEETAAAYRVLPAGQLGVLPGTPHPLERVVPLMLVAHLKGSFKPPGA